MSKKIEGIERVENVFGKLPSFHDAEVVSIELVREHNGRSFPAMTTLIRVFWSKGEKYDVQITFRDIFALRIENFNHQNVLTELLIEEFDGALPDRSRNDPRLLGLVGKNRIDGLNYYVKFDYCFGIEAHLFCNGITVDSVNLVEA